jgi:DNA polymerase-3 subunit delta
MIIYLYGEDTFRSHEQLNKMISEFKQKRDPQGYNVIFLDCVKEHGSNIFNEIMSAPFLSEKRMIVLENLLTNNDKSLLAGILERINNKTYSSTNILLVYQSEKLSKIKEVKELDQVLQKEKFAQKFDLLSGVQLANWIKEEVNKLGGIIKTDALNYLSLNVGSDMWYLKGLLNQLVAYVSGDKSRGGEEIELKDVKMFLDEDVDDNIFNMVDAIVSGNKKLGFKLLEKQRQMGEDDMKLFLMILRQFRILILMRSFYEENSNVSSSDMSSALSLHPFVVKKKLGSYKKVFFKRISKYLSTTFTN